MCWMITVYHIMHHIIDDNIGDCNDVNTVYDIMNYERYK